jgi:glycosyltransferase involved in cell wall biosynthesis
MSSGGAERVTANLASYWVKKGWQITIVTLAPPNLDFYHLDPSVRRISLNLAIESSNPFFAVINNIRRIFLLRKVLLEIQPDIALGMMTTANILLSLAALKTSNMIAIGSEHIHPTAMPLDKLWGAIRRNTYPLLRFVSALTVQSARWIELHTGAKNVPVIPNPICYPLPSSDSYLPTTIIKKNANSRRTLLSVGRLSHQKGFDRLLNAFAHLYKLFPDWDLVILGEGPLRSQLEQQIRDLRLQKRVYLPGAAGNMHDWYDYSDLYVMTSRFEGFPNTLLEALSYGLPAVSFDCETGPRDILRHQIDGLLVPQDDEAALVDALNRLMANEALRKRFSAKAVEARERYSIKKITGIWEKLFEEIKFNA